MKKKTTLKKLMATIVVASVAVTLANAQFNGRDLDINNISARINPMGGNFWDGVN